MKKAPKIEYGIEIVKPWSTAMYAHNDEVADVVRDQLHVMLDELYADLDPDGESTKHDELQSFGSVVVGYGHWLGFTNRSIMEQIWREIETAPYYRLNEIVEELGLELEKGFVGFS